MADTNETSSRLSAKGLLHSIEEMPSEDALRWIIGNLPSLTARVCLPARSVDSREAAYRSLAAAFLSNLLPASEDRAAADRTRLWDLLGGTVNFSELSDSAVRILISRAQALANRSDSLSADEATLGRAQAQLANAEYRLREREIDVMRRTARDADLIDMRKTVADLKAELTRHRTARMEIMDAFSSCRRDLVQFRRALDEARERSENWETIMGWVSRERCLRYDYDFGKDDLTPRERIRGLASRMATLTSEQLLWEISEEWRRGRGPRTGFQRMLVLIEVTLDRLWDAGGTRGGIKSLKVEPRVEYVCRSLPSTFRLWSESVRSRFGT